jgi:NitT/TauT family transport system substrate-binding protein
VLFPRPVFAENQTIRVSMAAQTVIYAPYLIAIEKGYYNQEGLTLDIKIAGGGVATPAQIAGTIDINTSGPVALTPILRGAALKIVYTEATHPVYQLWSTSKDLRTLQDLKGKQVGIISRGDTFELSMKMALLKAGLPLDWVSYTALGNGGALGPAFAARSLPAVILSSADIEQARKIGALQQGTLIVNMMKDTPMPYSGIAVTDAYLKDHADVVRGFLRATLKGSRYMRKFKPQTLAIVGKYNPALDNNVNSADYDVTMPLLTKDGTVPDDVLREYLQVQAAVLEVPKEQIPPVSRAWDYTIVREVNAAIDKSGWQPTA